MNSPCITIWRWDDAPEKYRALSQHGGDEDMVAFCPRDIVESCFSRLSWHLVDLFTGEMREELTGWGKIERHYLPDGSRVAIVAHA